MSKEQPASNSMRAITISREYGSGGGEIARRLSARLAWQLLDHQVVEEVARELGVSKDEAMPYDEHADSFARRLIESLQYVTPYGSAAIVPETDPQPEIDERVYHNALNQVLQKAVDLGHVVIVGRGGQMLFKERRDVLQVRIVAPLQARIAYVAQREGVDHEAAQARIQQKDRQRTRNLKEQYHQDNTDAHLYDLVINTGILDLQSAVDLILLALERKAQRLTVPQEALGPGAGLPRYSSPPGDISYSQQSQEQNRA